MQRTIDLHDADLDAFRAYKDRLVDYLERFIKDLVTIGVEISALLRGVEDVDVSRLLASAARREAEDAAPGGAQAGEEEDGTDLLAVVASLNERRSGRSDRSADFRTLAVWFAQAPDDDALHRLWRSAFGIYGSRHLVLDVDTLDAREHTPVPPSTSWAQAPSLQISPRLRRTGATSVAAARIALRAASRHAVC